MAVLSPERRRALFLLAENADGHTEGIMLAHGFTSALLAGLIDTGLATAHRERVGRRGKPMEVVRLRITDAGRKAIA